jgi:two-component system, NarL family, invasion response regulator UvrY
MTVKVLIVDDQPPFRIAAQLVFDILDDFEVVGEATSGEEAVEMAASMAPDLVVMDINLPGINGIEATRRIALSDPAPVVLLVSTYEADDLPAGASSSGALAYVHKEHFDVDLVEELWRERALVGWRTA